ncbi:MAG: MFS transporter [SAR202 cluster bacterium]|nr:MFS transporter [SAR202 cluster bacterium]
MTVTAPWRNASSTAFALLNGSIEIGSWVIMLPSIEREFDATKTAIAWVIVAFALGLAGAGLAAGRLADLVGLKRTALVTFAAEIALLAGIVVAPELWMLYPLRFLQGVARAGSTNAIAALLIGGFPPGRRGRVLGVRYALVYGGQMLGALFAGQATQAWGWRAAVAGIAAVTVAHTLLLTRHARNDTAKREAVVAILRRFDWPGAAAFFVSIGIFIFSIQLLRGGTEWWGVACLLVAAAILALAIRIERTASTPALDLKLFRNARFTAATASLMIMSVGTGTANFLFPFYMQQGLGWSPGVSGAVYVAMNMSQMLASPLMGGITDRFGARRLVVAGAAVVVLAFVAGSMLRAGVSQWQVAAVMLAIGAGMVTFETPNNTVIFNNAGPTLGSASAITGVYRYVGLSLGGAVGATLITVVGGGDVILGFQRGMLVLAAIIAIGLSLAIGVQLAADRRRAAAAAGPG